MTSGDIERYFQRVSSRWTEPVNLLLFGGGASILLAEPRFTEDLDLELQPVTREGGQSEAPARLMATLQRTASDLGLKVQAGEQSERRSMINWADYRKHQRLWKRFGGIAVYLLEPEYYALTKLSRSSETDLADIQKVFTSTGGSWRTLAEVCGRALRESPVSTAQGIFRR